MKQTTLTLEVLQINEVLDMYLRLFGELSILTAEQVTKRFYKRGMLTTVQPRLNKLVKKEFQREYLHVFQLPTVKSKSPNMYALSEKGVDYLRKEHGLEIAVQYKPSELKELSHPFLWHLLELNDFIILSQTLERVYPEYFLETFRHDLYMKKNPIRIADGTKKNKQGETVTKYIEVVPDSLFDIRMRRKEKKPLQWSFWLELDRGTEQTEASFKEKIRRIYLAIKSGKLQEYFGIKHLSNVIFATTTGENRVEQMRRWTMSVLADLHAKPEMVELFLFAYYASSMNHEQVFFEERWISPLKEVEPVALLGE